MDDHGPQYSSADDQTYAEDRRTRLHRDRLVGFSVFILLWALSVVPLARESTNGRTGADVVAVYLAVGAISLGVAAVIRGIYVLLKQRPFWSPWVFLIAAILAVAGYVVQSAGEDAVPIAGAHPESRVADRGSAASRAPQTRPRLRASRFQPDE